MTRKALLESYEALVDAALERKKPGSLFDAGPLAPLPEAEEREEYDRSYLLALEREALGFYISGHPLDGLERRVEAGSSCSVAKALTKDDEWVTLGGVFTFVEVKRSKRGEDWAVAMLEDKSGSIECLFFARSYAAVRAGMVEDSLVFVKGKVSGCSLIATELEVPSMEGR